MCKFCNRLVKEKGIKIKKKILKKKATNSKFTACIRVSCSPHSAHSLHLSAVIHKFIEIDFKATFQ